MRLHSLMVCAMLCAAPVRAGDPVTPGALLALSGDLDYGAYLAGDCLSCHRADGADAGIPGIVGWDEAQFRSALHAYRIGTRRNPAMESVARTLGDAEIAALSAWFGRAR